MPLLVSVRSPDEVPAALAGGADIIDAKEPARGSLGPVEPPVLSAIAARTPGSVPLSVALGDCTGVEQVRAAVDAARLPARSAAVYLKLGLAGVQSVERITALLKTAVAAAAEGARRIVPVAYADHEAAGTPAPEHVLRAAIAAGAHGFLVDTWRKDGHGLLDHLTLERLGALAGSARAAGVLFAAAGSLDRAAVPAVASVADVVGVRGAACHGGRCGVVDAGLVAELRRLAGARPALSPVA